MKRFIFIFVVIIIFLFAQIFLSTQFYFLKSKPDILLLLVIFFTIYFGLIEGIFCAMAAGVLKDAFSLNTIGMNLLIFICLALIIAYLKKLIYRETIFMIFITTLLVNLLSGLLVYFINFFDKGITLEAVLLFVILPEVILTAFLSPPVFFCLKKCALKFSM
ncbi:MAG: rod shape-determining protein MreD [Candidatus Omnitrophota bacterium]|nr:rod shape-determining protein MreD [Candidatus Omnitrophota bacterium]